MIRDNIAMWVDCFKTLTLLETLKIPNRPREDFCVSSAEVEHYFPQVECVKKNKTSVSHISTESEVISLAAGLRMDGIPALNLWDLVQEVLHSSKNLPVRRDPL